VTEMLFHVNEADEVLGQVSRQEAHEKGVLHRSGMVFLVNSHGDILITMRSAAKETFPSRYDASVTFHVTYGETYAASAQRETLEEIGIVAPLTYLGKLLHHDPPEHQIVAVFLCTSDTEPNVDRAEVSGHHFYSRAEIDCRIMPSKITPWLRDGWTVFLKYFQNEPKAHAFERPVSAREEIRKNACG